MLPRPVDQPSQAQPAPSWALAPAGPLIHRAVREGLGPVLLREWEDIVVERPWAGLPVRLQRAIEQSSPVTAYCHAFAAKAGLDLVPVSQAEALRLQLMAANEPQPPLDISI